MYATIEEQQRCMLFRAGASTKCFVISDIVRLEARSNYTYVHFINHPPLLMAKVLCQFEELLLPHGFIRTHRGHLINPQFVMDIYKNGNILLHDNTRIPFSRRRKKEVMRFFNQISAQLRAA
jgi:two-component system, LytTR family, response regulator